MARRGRSDLPTLTVRYFDSLTDPRHETVFVPKSFPQFLSKLTDMSAEVSDKIKGVANPPRKYQGFTLSDGSWWYRIVTPGPKHVDANGQMTQPMIRGDWQIVKTHADFDRMCEGAKAYRAVIEVEHVGSHAATTYHLTSALILLQAQQRARDHAPQQIEEEKVQGKVEEPEEEEKIEKTKVAEEKVEESKVEKKLEKFYVAKKMIEEYKEQKKLEQKKLEQTKMAEKKTEKTKVVKKEVEKPKVVEKKEEAEPVNPSPFAIWEQWIWPPIIVDGSGTRRWPRQAAEESDDESDD